MHFIGIGGTGLSAIARVLLESGYTVSGSDRERSPLAQAVEAAGARVFIGHAAENVRGAQLVIRSSAIPDDNPEVQAARQAGIPVLKRADFLGRLMEDRLGIAIAGSHGKTTTTAMTAWVLTALGQQPGFIVGSVVENLGVNARAGEGKPFVIEADEYDYMFLGLRPQIAVVTNVEHDHPDLFPTPEVFYDAFLQFVRRLPPEGVLIYCADDPGAESLGRQAVAEGWTSLAYSLERSGVDYAAVDLRINARGAYDFTVLRRGDAVTAVRLGVPGRHNAANALAVLAVCDQLELPLEAAANALAKFRGSGRRFQVRGEVGDVIVVDDYAHHPTEIRATLQAARVRYPERRIWAVWQPHTYTRTKTLFDDFAAAFDDADGVLVTEVYRAREPVDADFSAAQVVAAMQHANAHFTPALDDATNYLLAHLRPGDVVLVLSAGDAPKISEQVLAGLAVVSEES